MIIEFMNRSANRDGPEITMSYWRTIRSYQVAGSPSSSSVSLVTRVRVVKRFT
jgi:hypothetical protein